MSELQERLKHLINYSSQLIFVSGDTIAQQQRSLEDFLSVQQEDTEISYFTAEITMESPDFRRIICRQLLGTKLGSFNKPLNELLKNLHQQPGPFLLCIKQAQMLPNAFLQELWDWVCESKKHSQDHHVNVILFGESAWAEKAKKWLPKKNKNRPVLLSSTSVSGAASFDLNALETLMADDVNTSARIYPEDTPPLVTRKWFISLILFLLLVVFVGLMTWQYPQKVKHFLSTGELEADKNLVKDELAELNRALDKESALLQQEPPPLSDELISSDQQTPSELVSSWQDAKQASEEKVVELKALINEEKQADASTAGDFAVPDILSVEQLDAQLGESLIEQATTSDDNSSEKRVTTQPTTVESRFNFNEDELLSLAEPAVLLQLSGIQNRSVLDEFIADNQLSERVWVYETNRYGGVWHVVLLNQAFTTIEEARSAVTQLPIQVREMQPFAKDLRQIKAEIANKG